MRKHYAATTEEDFAKAAGRRGSLRRSGCPKLPGNFFLAKWVVWQKMLLFFTKTLLEYGQRNTRQANVSFQRDTLIIGGWFFP